MLVSAADAVKRTLQLLALPGTEQGTAYRVRRLDGQGSYFVVCVPGHVAALDEKTGELLASGDITHAPLILTRDEALHRAGLGTTARADLVWKPCGASQSMFDPIWAVKSSAKTLYVDQRGQVLDELQPKRPGGGAG
jgi:hypothetical protein